MSRVSLLLRQNSKEIEHSWPITFMDSCNYNWKKENAESDPKQTHCNSYLFSLCIVLGITSNLEII